MREVADNVWQITCRRNIVNAFLVGDVLVDAGMPWDADLLMAAIGGRPVSAHVITHAHPDHMGSSHAMCERLGVPFWAGARDVACAEDPGRLAGEMLRLPVFGAGLPRTPVSNLMLRAASGPGHRVDRALREGDEVAGFEVLDTPGHTAGHIALWREADRVLIAGDAIWNSPWLTVPFRPVNRDHGDARRSARRIAELRPEVACFGHGAPVRDPARMARFAAAI